MNFGKIESFMLMGGGGPLIARFASELKKNGFRCIVVVGPRNVNEEECLIRDLEENKIQYIISENINSDSDVLKEISTNMMGISYGAPWILNENFINKFNGKLLNIHGVRLPQDRGGATLSWLIIQNRRLGYCLMHKLEKGIDKGPIIKFREFHYPHECRIPIDYRDFYEKQNDDFLKEFVTEIKNGADFKEIHQLEYLSTYWPRISTEHHGFIDWNWNLKQIELFICAFDEPYAGASTFLNGERVFVKSCYVDYSDGSFHPYQIGLVFRKTLNSLFIATIDGTLIIQKITNSKGNNIINDVKLGDRLYTPTNILDNAKQFRANFTSKGLKE